MTDTTTIPTEQGVFAVVADRTVRGLLLPWGEESRLSQSGTKPIRFAKDTVAIPRDPSVVTLNVEHDRFNPVGRATRLESTEAGIVAEFAIADTDEGDAYLAAPEKRRLSAELADIVRQGVEGIKARLTGSALVTEGAFASAGLFALGDVTDETPVAQPTTDEDGVLRVDSPTLPETVTVTTPDDEATYSKDEATDDAADAAEQEEADMSATATAPATAVDTATLDNAKQAGANAVFAAMVAARHGDSGAEGMLAALSDIKISGSGALPATGVLQPDWVGEVWSGRAYQRKFIPLGTTGTIKALDQKGFRLDQGTALVTPWAGNKAPIGSGTASTSVISSILEKFGYAADIAREYIDLPGGEQVLAAFWAGVVESYARVTDEAALAHIVNAAGAPVAAETFPAGYPTVMGMLIQGIEHIEDDGDTPTFAIMNRAAWRQALYTPKDQVPEFVNFNFGTGGEGAADGFQVVRGDLGIEDTPAVLVGSKAGIRFNEVGTTPVQFDALDVAKGGIDRGVVGYLQTLVEREDSFVLIGQADA